MNKNYDKVFSITENHSIFTFKCKSVSRTCGFTHICELFINDIINPVTVQSVHYINRTWEPWQFCTVCNRTISHLIDLHYTDLLSEFKRCYGYKRITAKRQIQFNDFVLLYDIYYQSLVNVRDTLSHKSF